MQTENQSIYIVGLLSVLRSHLFFYSQTLIFLFKKIKLYVYFVFNLLYSHFTIILKPVFHIITAVLVVLKVMFVGGICSCVCVLL